MRFLAVCVLVIFVLVVLGTFWFLRGGTSMEVDVYTAVLEYQLGGQRPDLAVMSKATDCDGGERLIAEFDEELVASFLAANVRGRSEPDIAALASHVDVAAYTSAGLTRNGQSTAPDAVTLVYLSRVGFTEDGRQALVCLESPWQANAYLLRAGRPWTVVRELTLWMM